jgi:hypothetical protein
VHVIYFWVTGETSLFEPCFRLKKKTPGMPHEKTNMNHTDVIVIMTSHTNSF